ncbi:hypothetical protein Tco_1364697, partial [Tanacetum coccineum]
KYNKVKAKLALLSSSVLAPSLFTSKNKGLIAESYDLDEEEVSSDDEETEIKALMALTDEERISVGKESARNGEWTKITIKKVHILLEMEDNDDRKSFLDYLCIDLNYVEEQRNNLSLKHRNLVQELNACKEQLSQIPTQKKKILGIGQLTEDTSSCGLKDMVFIKSLADNSDMSITSSNLHKSSEAEDSTLPNHDTDEVPSKKSQRNTIDPSVVVSDSPASDYDSADESLVCSTHLLPLKKLDSVEHGFGPKTVKSILKSNSTFKAETLKGITLNEPSSAPARGNKSSSASKTNSAPTGKLKNVKVEDDPPLAMVMKELNELKLQISKKMSSAKEPLTELVIMLNLCPPYIQISIILIKVNLPQDPDLQDPQHLFLPAYIVDIIIIILIIVYTIPLVKYEEAMIITLMIITGLFLKEEESILEILNMSQKIIKHVVAMFIPHLITMTLSGSGKEKLLMPRKLNHQML